MTRFTSLTESLSAATLDRMRRELTLIIPAHRCGRFLGAAVESALYSSVSQVLVSEDASGDDTLEVARHAASRHPGRVRVLRNDRRLGAGANVNRAVESVRTPYFAKLDGDDVLIPGYLERAFALIASDPDVSIVSGHDLRIMADEALEFDPDLMPQTRLRIQARIMSGTDAYRFILRWSPNPCSSGAVYRTSAFREIGGFDEQIQWGEDWEIWFRLARKWSVAYNDAPSALYRIHPGSLTATHRRQNSLCFGYDGIYRRASEVCADPELRPILRHAFLRVAKAYLGAAARQVGFSRSESLVCIRQACRALASGIAL